MWVNISKYLISDGSKAFQKKTQQFGKKGGGREIRTGNLLPGAVVAAESNTQLLAVKYRGTW